MSSNIKRWMIVILTLLLVLSETVFEVFAPLRYIDEGLTILLGIYIIFRLGYLKRHHKGFFTIFIMYAFLVIIGLTNNMLYKVQTNFVAIAIDVVATVKLIVFVIAMYLLLDPKTTHLTLKTFSYIAVPFLFLGFIFSLINLVYDVGMRGQERFGLFGFNFIFDQAHAYTMFVFFFVLVLTYTVRKKVHLYRYYFYAIVQVALTLKGPSFIWCALSVLLLLYFKKFKKIGVVAVLVIGLLALSLGTYQIQTYFLDETAPRAKLFIYGIETLKNFHYMGAGFGTYGSFSAAKYYSPLYVKYGFEGSYGMSSNDYQFLTDTYWPMLLGQFGIIGTLIVAGTTLYMFRVLQKKRFPNQTKAILFSCFIYLLIHSVGSSTPTISSAAIMAVGMVMLTKGEEYRLLYARYVYEKEKSFKTMGQPANVI